jgi:ADP-L-glycero-D-manno-heptose 6-epimerase
MSSVVYHFFQQVINSKSIELFAGQNGVDDGEQQRDFIHVDDCVAFKRWLMGNSKVSGIFNCGTGVATTFNDVANIIKNWAESELGEKVTINYIDFPQDLVGKYQDYTCADMSRARKVGYKYETKNLENGIISYLNYLNEKHKY